ncbi:MAG: ferredoxin family protein [Candidatus Omnitrophota bacterium]
MAAIEEILIGKDKNKKECCGCELCVDICPTKVFKFDEAKEVAVVGEVEDCIGCLSCTYICPANIIEIKSPHIVQNFYREIEFSRKLEKFI